MGRPALPDRRARRGTWPAYPELVDRVTHAASEPDHTHCRTCASVNPPHAKFCGTCGAGLAEAPAEPLPAPEWKRRLCRYAAVAVVLLGMSVVVPHGIMVACLTAALFVRVVHAVWGND